mmetsp:Transcript_11718/g.31610  ORF Transcript_11718/g.31610 Transcript_11718/m.31610 type:complete len:362 (+) Transcript_11718:465-1550(+)
MPCWSGVQIMSCWVVARVGNNNAARVAWRTRPLIADEGRHARAIVLRLEVIAVPELKAIVPDDGAVAIIAAKRVYVAILLANLWRLCTVVVDEIVRLVRASSSHELPRCRPRRRLRGRNKRRGANVQQRQVFVQQMPCLLGLQIRDRTTDTRALQGNGVLATGRVMALQQIQTCVICAIVAIHGADDVFHHALVGLRHCENVPETFHFDATALGVLSEPLPLWCESLLEGFDTLLSLKNRAPCLSGLCVQVAHLLMVRLDESCLRILVSTTSLHLKPILGHNLRDHAVQLLRRLLYASGVAGVLRHRREGPLRKQRKGMTCTTAAAKSSTSCQMRSARRDHQILHHGLEASSGGASGAQRL